MQLVAIYNDWSQALIATSCLESYGLHPFIPNEIQLRVNPFKIIAFGGIRIFLPDAELSQGQDILATQSQFEITDCEPVKPRIWRRKFKALIFCHLPVFALAIFIWPIVIFFLWLAAGLYIIIAGSWGHSTLLSPRVIILLFVWAIHFIPVAMLLHAEYIAVPKLRRQKDTS